MLRKAKKKAPKLITEVTPDLIGRVVSIESYQKNADGRRIDGTRAVRAGYVQFTLVNANAVIVKFEGRENVIIHPEEIDYTIYLHED